MERLTLASAICPSPNFAGAPAASVRRRPAYFAASSQRERLATVRTKRFLILAANSGRIEAVSSRKIYSNAFERLKFQRFASISSSSTGQISTASGTAPPVPPPPSYIGSPLFWVGIGVGLSALFSVVVTKVKNYAMQQAFSAMMNQQAPQSGPPYTNPQFPFPFPVPPQAGAPTPGPFAVPPQTGAPTPGPFAVPPQAGAPTPGPFAVPPQAGAPTPGPSSFSPAQPPATEDLSSSAETERSASEGEKAEEQQKKFSFVDVSPEEKKAEIPPPPKEERKSVEPEVMGSTNGSTFNYTGSTDSSQQSQSQSGGGAPYVSFDQIEKMLEDPMVQKMIYPYLPEDMRNPMTLKWMMQNPQYRQQLQDLLNNMGTGPEAFKMFDINNPEVKQQFDQIGMSPDEVVHKIMSNPSVAQAFQNPKIQAAIMDCSQNPLNISKYQNDKEIMDVFNKIAEMFPGVAG